MKTLTEDKLSKIAARTTTNSIKNLCNRYGKEFGIDPTLLLSIYAIESFYRPYYYRVTEYALVVIAGLSCLLLKKPFKNFTIGKCQLGLATILNYYGYNHYQHAQQIYINSLRELRKLMSIISMDTCICVLAYRLAPITKRAKKIYPNQNRNYLRYIGEQFNGRYSYGMLFSDVYFQLKTHA